MRSRLPVRWCVAAAASLLAAGARAGTAQDAPTPPRPATCYDSAGPIAPRVAEDRTRTLYVVAELGYRAPDTTRLYATYLLEQFVKEFRHPTPLAFTAWGSPDSYATNVAVPVIAAEMLVVVKPDGKLRRAVFTQTSLIPAIDAAFDAAIRKTLEGDALPPPSVLRIRGDVTLFIALTFDPYPTLPPVPSDWPASQTKSLTPPPRVIERSLLRVQVPTSRFSAPPRRDEKGSKRVVFPYDRLARGMDGDVSVQYVIGRDGRVTPGSIRLVGATERGFADRILRTVKDARYFPAEIDGCPVPALIIELHAFRIDRR